jgi:hypothetical protein
MSEEELDRVYTQFCRSMGDAEPAKLLRVLSRFTLLAMLSIDDPDEIERLTARALQE